MNWLKANYELSVIYIYICDYNFVYVYLITVQYKVLYIHLIVETGFI